MKNRGKLRGCTNKTTYFSAAYCLKVAHFVSYKIYYLGFDSVAGLEDFDKYQLRYE